MRVRLFYEKIKRYQIFFLIILGLGILVSPFIVNAQVSLGFPSSLAGLSSQDLKTTISNLVRVIFGFLGILLVLLLLYGGFLWMTSQGNEQQIERAKKVITSAVIGLVLVLSAFGIASFIVNSLVGGTGGGNGNGGGDDGGPCVNCLALGNGIIESHYPGVNAINIPRNTKIIITFKEAVTQASMTAANVQIKNLTTGAPALTAGEVQIATVDQLTYVLTPNNLLGSPSVKNRYQVSLQNIDKASGGAALPLGYQWQFTVSTASDTTPPTITSVIPIANSTVSRNTIVQVNFSEGIDPSGITGPSPAFTVTQSPSTAVAGVYTIGNQYKTAEFRTTDSCGTNSCGGTVYCLAAAASFSGLVSTGIKDLAGNPLAADYQWGFNTNASINTAPPVITHQEPRQGDAGVSTMDPAEVYFDKEMSFSSLNSQNINLSNTGFWLESGNVAGKTQVQIQHQPFEPYTDYDISVLSGVKDIFQNCYSPCSCNSTDGSCGCKVSAPGCSGLNCTSIEPLP
jgi:hypothetical protein